MPKPVSLVLLLLLLTHHFSLHAQNSYQAMLTQDPIIDLNKDVVKFQKEPGFINDLKIPTPQLYQKLKTWHTENQNLQGTQLLFFMNYEDTNIRYKGLPVKVFLPANFNPLSTYPAIVYLHGATKAGTFESDVITKDSGDLFTDYFRNNGFIIIKPYADNSRKFSWNPNPFFQKTNYTFRVLEQMVSALKKRLPIEENKVFALGHSDGGDGAFCLALYNPSLFAGFYCYNTMATQLFANDIYINNLVNKPIYLIHSDQDALRPINTMNQVIDLLNKAHIHYYYKVYNGYKHFDKHLENDLPNALKNMNSITRNPLPDSLTWESKSPDYNGTIHWLKITEVDLADTAVEWHKTYNFTYYVKEKGYEYYQAKPGGKIIASYANNTFTIRTSKIKQFEIFISPEMVDLTKPVKVIVNNKTSSYKLQYDRQFMIDNFTQNYDRSNIWCNKILIKIDL